MSRLGKMPGWQKWFVLFGMLSCSISGTLYLLGHEFQIQRAVIGSSQVLSMHGIAAMLATLALGSALPFHIKAGVKSKRKLLSGIGQLCFLAILMISGALLYYGPEQIREGVIEAHWTIGILFLIIFIWHVLVSFQKKH
jgi:hypothetical protein